MLPTLSETAVVLSALARIARRAARLEASAPTTSASSDFHARFNAPHAADRFRSARPWPSALADARVHKGFTGAVTLKTPVSRPDDYEEELLRAVDTPVTAPGPAIIRTAPRPWTTQVDKIQLRGLEASVQSAATAAPESKTVVEIPVPIGTESPAISSQPGAAEDAELETTLERAEEATSPDQSFQDPVLACPAHTVGAFSPPNTVAPETPLAIQDREPPAEFYAAVANFSPSPPLQPREQAMPSADFTSSNQTSESPFTKDPEPTPVEELRASTAAAIEVLAEERLPSSPSPVQGLENDPSIDVTDSAPPTHPEVDAEEPFLAPRSAPLTASKVPSSRLGRLFHYGSLGVGLAWGAAGTFISPSQQTQEGGKGAPRWMSESNIRLLVNKLSTMRGAALKLGQFLSIQDSHLLPPELETVLARVQNAAHYMPAWQLEKVMSKELGSKDWRERWFEHFEEKPFAAASIGQVHVATLRRDLSAEQLGSTSEAEAEQLRGKRVAVKVQFPGVKDSISSDLSYLRWLVSASSLLPKGLFLENTMRVMEKELEDECDYAREAEMNRRFRDLVENDDDSKDRFTVPKVVDALSTGQVLTTEMMSGVPLTQAIPRLSQDQKNAIATSILELSLRELFKWRLMQTDPNWTNFLWNAKTRKVELIDFGATREYSHRFMDSWFKLLSAAMEADREECRKWSLEIGYLTGEESETMVNAHLESMIALGEPFRSTSPSPYNFTNQAITERVRAQIPVMLRERLTPPPSETYSLNRKLSGAFLLCAKLNAHVKCREMMMQVTREYRSQEQLDALAAAMQVKHDFTSSAAQTRGVHTSARALRTQRYGREGTGRNLGDRWPRSLASALKHEADRLGSDQGQGTHPSDQFATLSPIPTGAPSISSAPSGSQPSDLFRNPVPAESSSAPQDPSTATETRTSTSGSGTYSPTAVKDIIVRGVSVPRKPEPPGPEDCCMSGCARCVYDLYAEDLQDYHEDLSEARAKLLNLQPPIVQAEWNEDLLGKYPDDQGRGRADGGSFKAQADSDVDAVIAGLDPSMKAFLEMERRMKKKQEVS